MIFSKKKDLKNYVDRVMNKLVPESVSQAAQENSSVTDHGFMKISREIKVLTARNIATQIHERESSETKMSGTEVAEFVTQKCVESGWKDDRICQDILAMVTK